MMNIEDEGDNLLLLLACGDLESFQRHTAKASTKALHHARVVLETPSPVMVPDDWRVTEGLERISKELKRRAN